MSEEPEIRPEDHMADVLEAIPGARRALFAAYHVGGCQSCAYRDDESLAEVCARNEIPVEEAMATLRRSHAHDRELLWSPQMLQERLADPQATVHLVDTRTREEHEAVRFPGARLLTQELQQELFGTPPEGSIVLIDHQGRDVLDHCAWFRGHGLDRSFALEGGIDAWSRMVDSSIPRYRLEAGD